MSGNAYGTIGLRLDYNVKLKWPELKMVLIKGFKRCENESCTAYSLRLYLAMTAFYIFISPSHQKYDRFKVIISLFCIKIRVKSPKILLWITLLINTLIIPNFLNINCTQFYVFLSIISCCQATSLRVSLYNKLKLFCCYFYSNLRSITRHSFNLFI